MRAAAAASAAASAEILVFRNARIWRPNWRSLLDDGRLGEASWFSVDVAKGVFKEVGEPGEEFDEEKAGLSSAHRVIDLRSSWVFPGFHDSHLHLSVFGQRVSSLDLAACESVASLKDELRRYADGKKEAGHAAEWLVGFGWDEAKLDRLPTLEDLDEVVRDAAVFLHRVCLHAAVVNSKALELSGIAAETAPRTDGSVEYDDSGRPTGLIRESACFQMESSITRSRSEKRAAIQAGMAECLRLGVTSGQTNEFDPESWSIFNELHSVEGSLPWRTFFVRMHDDAAEPATPTRVSSTLSCDRVKFIADGSVGAETAALSRPYKGRGESERGELKYEEEEVKERVAEAAAKGFRVETHAIGDRCAEQILHAYETSPSFRPILTHCQFLTDDLIRQMSRLGVVASVQPSMVCSDAGWLADKVDDAILADHAYAWKSLSSSGVSLAFGSDAPVEYPSPALGVYDAVFRQASRRDPDVASPEIFKPEERLTVGEAVDAYTTGAAWAAGREDSLGQIAPGFEADFVVVEGDVDPVTEAGEWRKIKFGQVWVAGKRRVG